MRLYVLLSCSVAMLAVSAAQAEDAPPARVETSRDIIVTAPFERARGDVLSGTSVLSGAALTRELRPTIGETLARLPGVSATSFGPNSSRPVLRGFQGERVRVLKDGIGSIDVSNTSVDHAVVVNPLTADRIEVLRGPAALLFGSSAIGGVVNVLDNRIPRRLPDAPVRVDALATYGSAARERSAFGQVDVPLAGKFVVHVDGSYLRTGDLRTAGFILAEPLRAAARLSPAASVRSLTNLRGRLPNSAAETWEIGAGAALVTDGGTLGASFSHYDSLYGVPIRFSLDPSVDAEQVRLKVKQDRADLRGEIDVADGFLQSIKLRAGFADYRHAEIDAAGVTGTTFLNKSIESRLELVQRERGGWRGATGGQFFVRDFNVIGAEAFVPKNTTQQFGVFTLQTYETGRFRGEIGARFEHTALQADASPTIGSPFYARKFDAYSGSLGGSYGLTDGIRVGISGSHTERAPAAEELFANGPHAGTQAFEIGNPNFRKETSNGIESSLRGSGDGYTFSVAVYHDWFNNFIYESQAGAVQDDLPVFQFRQAKARYWGVEGEASVKLAQFGSTTLNADLLGDMTRARIVRGGPVPRIPALRLLGGLEAQSERLDARVEVEWTDKQTRVAAFETRTPGFTLVNASVTLRPFGRDNRTSLVLSANNIFDVEARRAASFLKEYAPLSGRDFRVTGRVSF